MDRLLMLFMSSSVRLHAQVELAALEYRSSRLVRVLDSATGQRMGFGEGGATEVVSARYTSHTHRPADICFNIVC